MSCFFEFLCLCWMSSVLIGCFDDADGMGTAEWRSAKSPAYFKRGDYVPGLKVRFESLQCSYVSLGRVVDEVSLSL